MIIKVKRSQIDYLNYNLSGDYAHLKLQLRITKKTNHFFVEVDDAVADDIRDWAGEMLQKKGFDADYNLTVEGKVLDELIDLFYVG